MDALARQVELIRARILTVVHASPPPYIHCSKINCLIRQLKEVATALGKVQIDSGKKIAKLTKNLSALHSSLDQFQVIHAQCCSDVCAQIALTVSIRSFKTEITAIRASCMKSLEALGFPSVAQLLALNQGELESQDHVDVKRLAVIMNQLQMKPALCKMSDVADHLQNRMNSLDALGITLSEEREAVVLPEIPSSLNLIVQHDQIELFEEIGSGQSGKVFRGIVKCTNEEVAVKMLKSTAASVFEIDGFRREVTTMATLKHPSLLKFCGYTTEKPYYLLTEYMANGSLYDFLEKRPEELTPTDRTLIALDIARGMEFLHGRGIIHRDLKSLNILLDSRKRAKICDFGLIRMKSSAPMTGLVGTSNWMAPEVLQSLPFYDEKVDVYSFGIVLWELLTGKKPYQDPDSETNPLNLIVEITDENLRPVIPETCPPLLRSLIEACWQADPKLRPSFHKIIPLLSDPLFQFPGCELVVLTQETGVNRHAYSLSSPTQTLRGRHVLRTMSAHRLQPTSDCLTRAIGQVADAMALGHMEHFNNALERLKYAGKAPNVDFEAVMPQLTAVVTTSHPRYRPQLVQVLFDILSQPKAVECFDQTLIARMLNSKSEMVVSIVQSQLSMNPNPSFFGPETINALLGFANNSNQAIRVRSLLLLLTAMDCVPVYFIENPELIQGVLSFSGRKLPSSRLESLLMTCTKMFGQLRNCPDSVIRRLVKMQMTLPASARPLLSKCIEAVLRFPNAVPYYEQFWQNSIEGIDQYLCLFSRFIEQLPPNATPMFNILVRCSGTSDEAFETLTAFVKKNGKAKSIIAELLPIESKNRELLLAFYSEMLDMPQVLRHSEFYAVAVDFIPSEKCHKLNELFHSESIEFQLFDDSEMPSKIVSLLNDESFQIPMLQLMYTIELRHDSPEFRKCVSLLFSFLENQKLSRMSFLILASMSRFDSSDFDFDKITQYAAEAVHGDDEEVRSASVFVLRTFFVKCLNRHKVVKRFLECLQAPTETVLDVARLFLEVGDPIDPHDKEALENLLNR